MSIHWPRRIHLAHTPTPLVRLPERGGGPPIEVWVKRDDLTGVALSGNKVRKLEFLCAEAEDAGAEVLITCGGVNSNHARATAVAAAQLELHSHLVLRGEDRSPPAGNLLLNRVLGADVTFIDAEAWRDRDAIMADLQARLAAEGRRAYVIPEGGSNAIGSLGYARAAAEILMQADDQGMQPRRIVHACGSGGTTAGLALGLAAADRTDVEVVAVAVCNDAAYFDRRINAILDQAVDDGLVDLDTREAARWRVIEDYRGTGYARTTPQEMAQHAAVARTFGLFLDPVYTGKAFRCLMEGAEADRFEGGGTVFLHTGGIFELFAFAPEIDALRAATASTGRPPQ